MPLYVYTKTYPRDNKWDVEEHSNPPGHRMITVKRRDKLIPGPNGLAYQAHCTCKWESDLWQLKKRLPMTYEKHLTEVSRQLRFDETGSGGIEAIIALVLTFCIVALVMFVIALDVLRVWLLIGVISFVVWKLGKKVVKL